MLDTCQDPWPSSSCNGLLLAEAFDQPGLPGWTPGGGVSWSCAVVELSPGGSLVSTNTSCRVLSADSGTVMTSATTSALTGPGAVPGAIRLFATGRGATVDHVRVYAMPGG